MALTITIESLIKDSLNSAWSMHSETTSLSLVFLCIAIHSFGSLHDLSMPRHSAIALLFKVGVAKNSCCSWCTELLTTSKCTNAKCKVQVAS